MSTTSLITLEQVRRAALEIAPHIHRTPLLHSRTFSEMSGYDVYLKCENLQKTGAFKVRGALHRLLRLDDEQRARGVATISAGFGSDFAPGPGGSSWLTMYSAVW